MSRKVFVSNLPVRGCVDAVVEIPDNDDQTPIDDLIAEAVKEGKFEYQKRSLSLPDDVEVDEPLLAKWEFCTPLEES